MNKFSRILLALLLTSTFCSAAATGTPKGNVNGNKQVTIADDARPTDSKLSSNPKESGRKKVAVVLSGGGAKGVAHIGVLKVIERAGIPIDIVTGTSMGSIVGGLYAIGYNAEALDSVVRAQDWSYVISDKERLTQQTLEDRRKQNTYAISTGLTFGKGSQKEGGIIKGKNLAELFHKLCEGYTDSLDFSRDLPIPFACVATNIIDNTEVDFHRGRLPQAMRASMAIPAAFAPVRLGDKVLVDGGLRNNFPVDIAKEMGADIVIGVTVQGAPRTADDLGSTMSIIGQIVDVNCKNKYDDNLAMTDVPIRVNTEGYSTASFSKTAIDTLLRRGEEAAMKHWDEIVALKKRIGIDDSFRPQRLKPRNPTVMQEKRRVTAYEFQGMTPQDERFLLRKFHLKEGDSISADREQQLTTSMRVDLFYQTAECLSRPDGDGVRVVLTAGQRKTAQASAGFRFDLEEHAALQLGAALPIAKKTPLDFDATMRLGKRIMGRGVLTLHALNADRPQVAYTFRRNDMDIYMNGKRAYNILYHQHQVDLTPINVNIRNFNLTAGARWDYFNHKEKLGRDDSQALQLENDHYISYRATLEYNSEDSWYFPSRGSRLNAGYSYITDNFGLLAGHVGVSEVHANWRTSVTFGRRFTLRPMAYGRLILGDDMPMVFTNTIGGQWFGHYVEQQMPFAGMGYMEHVDRHLIAVQLDAQQRIGNNHYIVLNLGLAQQAEKLNTFFDKKMFFGSQIGYSYNTFFGPVGAWIGYNTKTKDVRFYLNVGHEF